MWFGSYFAQMNELVMLSQPIPRKHLLKIYPSWRYWTQPRNSVQVPAEYEEAITTLLVDDAEISIGPRRRPATHQVFASDNGHEWCRPNKTIQWPYCWICLLIRRADKKNKPCKGPVELSLREDKKSNAK